MLTKSTIDEILRENKHHLCPPGAYNGVCVKIIAIADLPTRFGAFQVIAFANNKDDREHAAIIIGDPLGREQVPVRLHSECLTGDALGSVRCDCRDQLLTTLRHFGRQDDGVLLYLRQEGRGIGFINKIKAYALQDAGLDTIEADQALGFSGDEREYDIAAHMLHSLHIRSIKLLTNNPRKIDDLTRHGVAVAGRIPLIIPPTERNADYLRTKQVKAGHLLERTEQVRRIEQDEDLVIEQASTE